MVKKYNEKAKCHEFLAAYFLRHYIFQDIELSVGDSGNLPDIHNIDKGVGIEVVQTEMDSDLDKKYLIKKARGVDSNYDSVMKYAKEIYPNHNYTACNLNGKASGFISMNFLSRTNELQESIRKNLNKKYIKLNAGYYDDIKENINLCIPNIHRACGKAELDFLLNECRELNKRHERKFRKIFVLFRCFLAVIVDGGIVNEITFDSDKFDSIIEKCNRDIEYHEIKI